MNNDLGELTTELGELPREFRRSLRPNVPSFRAEPRGWRDVIRCLIGRHRVVLQGVHAGMRISRCSCDAMRVNGRPWLGSHPFRVTDGDGRTRRERKAHRRILEAVDRVVDQHFPERMSA